MAVTSVMRDAWRDASLAVWRALAKETPAAQEAGRYANVFSRHVNIAARSMPPEPPWGDAHRACLRDQNLVPSEVGGPHRPRFDGTMRMKAMRLGWAIAFRDEAAIYPSESEIVRTMAPSWDMQSPAPATPTSAPLDRAIPFATTFDQAVPGARTARVPVRTSGVLSIDEVDGGAAPVAWRLRHAKEGEGFLEVRLVDGIPFRPVMAPGTTRPATTAEFVAAAAGDVPWRDNPFAQSVFGGRTVGETAALAVSEYASEGWPRTEVDARAEAAAIEEALTRAGRIVSIDGIVHRGTPPPTFHVVATTIPRLAPWSASADDWARGEFGVAWRIGDLAMDDSQSTLPDFTVQTYDWLATAVDGRGGSRKTPAALAFPGDRLDLAQEMARLLAEWRMRHGPPIGAPSSRDAPWLGMSAVPPCALAPCPTDDGANVVGALQGAVKQPNDDVMRDVLRGASMWRSVNGCLAKLASKVAEGEFAPPEDDDEDLAAVAGLGR